MGSPVLGIDLGTTNSVVAVATDTYETVSAVLRVRGAIGSESERKIALAVGLFEDNVDYELLRERITVTRPTRTAPGTRTAARTSRQRSHR